MSELSAKSFLELVQKSGVVPPDQLKQALAELSRRAAGKPVQLEELTDFLVGEGLITPWHYKKLLTRKYKGFFIGQYKLLSVLGTGGMSTVYLAEHTLSKQRRAIKVLPRARVAEKSYLGRFLLEGRAAASLNHPNIVRIYDLANEADIYYMVMEYFPGVDLHRKIQDDGPAPIEDALRYLEQAASGLAHAHEKKIVHRDIKPANLLLTSDGTVKLLDLGLALLREEPESLTVFHNEKVMGTADYLAPEQALNSHGVDLRADIYSLGCTFYYLLTGQPPFPEGTIAQRIAMHQNRTPKPVRELRPDCPPAVEALCHRMMKKSPEERLENCERVIQAIERCRQLISEKAVAPAVAIERAKQPAAAVAAGGADAALGLAEPPVAAPVEPGRTYPQSPGQPTVKPGSTASTPVKAPAAAGPTANPTQPKAAPQSPLQPAAGQATPAAARRGEAAENKAAENKSAVSKSAVSKAVARQAGPTPAAKPVVAQPDNVLPVGVEQPGISPAEVGELASLSGARRPKRQQNSSLRTNLVIAGIVLFCFLVLVGMVIFLARMFGA